MFSRMMMKLSGALRGRDGADSGRGVVCFDGFEPLEDRVMLSTTLFVDFGAGIGMGNTLATTAVGFRDVFGANTGTNMTDTVANNASLVFTPLSIDFDLDGDTDNADITAMTNAVLPSLQRSLEPYDINIVVASATSFADALASVAGSADADAYVFIATVTSDGFMMGTNSVGEQTGLFGRASVTDLLNQANTIDEASLTFTDRVLSQMPGTPGTAAFNTALAQRIAYTAAHEAFHTYGYRHTPDETGTNPQAGANQRLMAGGDVIRRGSNTRSNPFIVTRYTLLNSLGSSNHHQQAANDPNIGLRDTDNDTVPDLGYATGTGAHDQITLTLNAGNVDVVVNPFSNAGRTTAIDAGESYSIVFGTDTEGEILVDASINSDQVVVDGLIPTNMRIRGGVGFANAGGEADLLTLQSGGLTGTWTPGAAGAGNVTYAGGADIDYSEFENIDANGIAIDLTSLTLDDATIDEGDTVTLSGQFANIDTLDNHTVTISWGDGSMDTVVVLPAGVREFDVMHTYDDDNPTGTSSDNYDIDVTVEDNDDGVGVAQTSVTVANVDPTIGLISLSAATINEAQSVTVSGSFSDPALGVSTESFTGTAVWSDGVATALSIDQNTGAFSTSRSFPDDHPMTGTPFDLFTVEITIDDDDGGTDAKDSPTLRVNNVDPVIGSFASDATFDDKAEEGEPVNIMGMFTDVGVLDTHQAVVDWGDGSPLEAVTVNQGAGFGSISGSHAYAAGGIYTITVTLTDDDTGDDVAQTTAVVTGVGLNNGVLYIIGSAEDDHVSVNQKGKNAVKVHASFIPEPFREYDLSMVDRVISYLCNGDDHLTIAGKFAVPTVVHGGAGNDHLHGGGGPTVLLGDEGDDKLVGQKGGNLLIGGAGEDDLVGGKSSDVLIGGTTLSDADDDALLDAALQWNGPGDYAARVAALIGSITAVDDGDRDTLKGASGTDLFYSGAGDVLKGAKPGETVV